jgi:hypothetical protein
MQIPLRQNTTFISKTPKQHRKVSFQMFLCRFTILKEHKNICENVTFTLQKKSIWVRKY